MIELSTDENQYPITFKGEVGRGEAFLQAMPYMARGLVSCLLNAAQGYQNTDYLSTGVKEGIPRYSPQYRDGTDTRVKLGYSSFETSEIVSRLSSKTPAIFLRGDNYELTFQDVISLTAHVPKEDTDKTPEVLRSSLYFKGLREEGDVAKGSIPVTSLVKEPFVVPADNSTGNVMDSLDDAFAGPKNNPDGATSWLGELGMMVVVERVVTGQATSLDYNAADVASASFEELSVDINLSVVLTIPQDIGAWLIGSPITGSAEEDYLPSLYSWSSKLMGASLNSRRKPVIKRNIRLDLFEANLDPRLVGHATPRYKDDRVLILANGRCVYLPPVKKGAVSVYNKAMLSLYDKETGKFHISSTPSDHPMKESMDKIRDGLRGMGLLEDWITETYFYTLSGNLGVGSINLTGSKATTNTMIMGLITADSLTNYISNIGTNLEGAEEIFANYFADAKAFLETTYPSTAITSDLDTLLGVWNAARVNASTNGAITAKALFVDSFTEPEGSDLEPSQQSYEVRTKIIAYALMRPLAKFLIDVGKKYKPKDVFSSFNDVVHKGPVMLTIGTYGDSMKSIYEEAAAEMQVNMSPISSSEVANADLAVPGVMAGMRAFPHQSKALLELDKEGASPATMLAIQPGGGKTIISILDMLSLLGDGKIKRPLLLAPTNLLGQWADAVSKFADGNLNYYAFTTDGYKIHGDGLFDKAKNAPRNTLFMASYSFISLANKTTYSAGGDLLDVYRNAIELQAFDFDYIVLDESHYLKNADSGRMQATSRLILNAKYVRFASGTLINDNPSDLVGVGALIDPSLFGKKTDFLARYSGKAGTWSDEAADKVNDILRTSSTEIRAKQSDWSFMLPKLEEHFHHAELTENQETLYDAILQEEIDAIMQRPSFAKKFNKLKSKDPEAADAMLEGAMRQFLTKAEMFLVNPKSVGLELLEDLSEEDMVSPKVMMADKIIDEHLASKDTGKIIVFYSNVTGTDHFMEYTKHKDISIQYHGNKKTDLSKFYYDDTTRVLVATESTLNTGFNFQFATRMIRIQTLWSPGDQAQALARIFRPDVDDSAKGKVIHFDWLIVNNTMDVTKVGKLIGKTVSNTKFEEVNNPYFDADAFPELDKIKMSPNVVKEYSTFDSISPYIDAYASLKAFRDSEFDRNSALFPEMIPVKSLPVPKDFSSIGFTPYVPNMSPDKIPGSKDLGLVRLLEYSAKLDVKRQLMADPLPPFDPVGSHVQTELGIGTVVKSSLERVTVKFAGGRKVSFGKDQVFLVIDPTEKGKKLLAAGLRGIPSLPVDSPVEDETEQDSDDTGDSIIEDEFSIEPNNMVTMFAGSFNNHLYLSAYTEDPDAESLLDYGYRRVAPYWVARINTRQQLEAIIDALDAKFTVRKELLDNLASFGGKLHSGKLASYDIGHWSDIKNFWLLQHRTVKGNVIRPYAIVEGGRLYVAVSSKAPAAHKLGSMVVKGVSFAKESEQVFKFFRKVNEAKASLMELSKAGIIEYKERLLKSLSKIHVGKALPSKEPRAKEPKPKVPNARMPRPKHR